MTDTQLLKTILQDIREIKEDIRGLEAFERKVLEHYVSQSACAQHRNECTGSRRFNSSHLVAIISLVVTGLVLLRAWGGG